MIFSPEKWLVRRVLAAARYILETNWNNMNNYGRKYE